MKRKEYKKKKVSKTKRFLKIVLLTFLVAALAVTAYGFKLHNQAVTVLDRSYESIDKEQPPEIYIEPAKDKMSILLIGVDESEAREGAQESDEQGRSDALVLATLNPRAKSIKLVSIPRDSYVLIPQVNYKDKITHAHSFGGTRATIDTVENMFEIPINHYVKMNFNAFIDVVDALGGVEVDVPYERIEKDEFDNNAIHLMPGFQRLDGRHTLALARTRKLDNDIERGKRQQMILQAMIKEATSVTSITKYSDIINALGDNMKTDMTSKQMLSFVQYIKTGLPEVETLNLDGSDDMSTGIYYYKLDEPQLEEVKNTLKAHLGMTLDSSETYSQ